MLQTRAAIPACPQPGAAITRIRFCLGPSIHNEITLMLAKQECKHNLLQALDILAWVMALSVYDDQP
jgi:hypothetical protein